MSTARPRVLKAQRSVTLPCLCIHSRNNYKTRRPEDLSRLIRSPTKPTALKAKASNYTWYDKVSMSTNKERNNLHRFQAYRQRVIIIRHSNMRRDGKDLREKKFTCDCDCDPAEEFDGLDEGATRLAQLAEENRLECKRPFGWQKGKRTNEIRLVTSVNQAFLMINSKQDRKDSDQKIKSRLEAAKVEKLKIL